MSPGSAPSTIERPGLGVDEPQVHLGAGQVVDAAQRAAEGVVGPEPQSRSRGDPHHRGDAPEGVGVLLTGGCVLRDLHGRNVPQPLRSRTWSRPRSDTRVTPSSAMVRDHVVLQDVSGSLHPPLSARHEAVEVGPAHEGRPRAARNGGDDVGAGQDPAVDVDLGAVPDRVDHLWQHLQGCGGAVQLASSVVGDDHRIGAGRDDGAGVVDRLDALDDQRAVPGGPQPRQVGHGQGRVEHPSHEVSHRPLEPVERGELQRLGGHQVEPPPRVQGTLGQGPHGQRRREGQAVSHVAQARTGDWCVHREDDGLEAGLLGPRDEVTSRTTVAPQVQLEPATPLRRRGREAFDGGRAQR